MAQPDQLSSALLSKLHDETAQRAHKKVTIVGAGAVGLAIAYSILNQGSCSELALCDVVEDKLRGEVMDLQHGTSYVKRCVVKGSADYAVSENSDVVIITAGARQREGESRRDLCGRNVEIFRSIIPQIVKYSPNSVLVVVSNPVDVMTAVTAKLAGFPPGRVFGTGTALDSSRFRTAIAEKLHVDPRSVHATIVGEHGDSSVACWSQVNVAGVRLRDLCPSVGLAPGAPGGPTSDAQGWHKVHSEVIKAAGEVIKLKGFTNWAIGLTAANIAECILRNEHRVLPLTVPVKGRYGITQDCYLSLPATLGIEGVRDVLTMPLADDEVAKLRESAEQIWAVQATLGLF